MTLVRELLHPPSSQQYNLTQTGGLDTFYTLLAGDKEDLSLEMEETYLRNVKNGFFIEAGASEGRLKIHKHKNISPVLYYVARRVRLPQPPVRGEARLDRAAGGAHGQQPPLQTPQGTNTALVPGDS